MNDFGSKVKSAERELKSKATVSQIKKTLPIPKGAPYGRKKDGTPRKRPATKGRWEKGVAASPDKVWKPGQSGNPGGRPSMKPITDALRAHGEAPYSGKEAKYKGLSNAQVLAVKQFELAIDTGDMRAATEIMDRIEGKTVQVTQLQGANGGAIQVESLSPEENERRIAELLALAGEEK